MIETLLAMDPLTVAGFLAAGIVLNLTPGADVMFATACGLRGGARHGIAASLGIAIGAMAHVLLAVAGVSAALAAVPHGLDVIRYAGAAYLAYLAVQAWRAPPPVRDGIRAPERIPRVIRRGALTNLLNPKVGLFVLAFLPQFTDPGAGPVWHQMLILGGLFITTGFFITAAYGAAAGMLGGALQARLGTLNKLSALVFSGLAARLALE